MIKIQVPATTANIGPGFDCFGIALNLYNTFYFEEQTSGISIDGCPDKYKNKDNLILTSFITTLEKLNTKFNGIKIKIDSKIPISSGLGSSSSCILAGVMAANALSNGNLTTDDILNIATSIEGHPDNLTPALLGGFTVSTVREKVYYKKFDIAENLNFISMTPNFNLETTTSRLILPKDVTFKDAVYNINTASFVLLAFVTKEYSLLKNFCSDRLHEPYRSNLIPDFNKIKSFCNEMDFLATYLSGAGPTIMSISNKDTVDFTSKLKLYLDKLDNEWNVNILKCNNTGTKITYLK